MTTEPDPRLPRQTSMRSALGPLIAAVALVTAGCGSSTSSTAADPGASTTPSTSGPTSPAGTKVHLMSMTGGGGVPSSTASPLNTPDQVTAFTQQFRAQALAHQITSYVDKVASGADVEGAVIAVGCDRPPGAAVQVDGDTVTITPDDVASPLQECLAPVTTVAIAVIPQG